MYPNAAGTTARSLVGAAIILCSLFAGNVAAKDHRVIVAIHVSTQGLDLSQPADARKLYIRLQHAAWELCACPDRVNLVPEDDLPGCREKALGGAIRSANTPMLTRIYLETHTFQAAAAYGIEVPAQVAAK
jgi:UrcA family protein